MSAATLGNNISIVLEDDEDGDMLPPLNQPIIEPLPRKAPVVSAATEKRVRIQLEESDEIPPTGQFFGLNGRSFILRPGEPADVPVGIINVLNDAIMSVPQVDPTTRQVIGYRNRLRFPYRLVSRDV
jgi:hypothetical protein